MIIKSIESFLVAAFWRTQFYLAERKTVGLCCQLFELNVKIYSS